MLKAAAIIIIALFFSCTLIEPCYIQVNNMSGCSIIVRCLNSDKKEVQIENNKKIFFLVYPEKVYLTIFAEEVNFIKEYEFDMKFQEKKEIVFNLEK